ncbi:hypothetical protein [Sphingomonas oryzagri]
MAIFAGVTAIAINAAAARDYALRKVGDWTVTASKDGKGCFLTREYESNGGTTLLLGLDSDGTNRLTLLNPNWSIKPKDKLKLNFRLSNSSYPAHFAIGIVSDGKQGFVTSFGAKFPALFAASKTLRVSRGDVPVERVDLDGAGEAVKQLSNCVGDQHDRPAATDGVARRSSEIPTDPFASAPRKKSKR